jgi:DNA-binding Xre family transcriptional regulator
MNWNKYRQDQIKLAMFQNEISKMELSEHLDMSYPTMLTKLKDVGTFKLSEFDKVCTYLNLDINELIIDNGTRN